MKGGIDMDFASFDSQEMPGGGWVVKPYTIYVNPYLVFNGDGYSMDTSPDRFTKHYYAGSERIASRLNREGQNATEHTTSTIYSPTAAYAPVLVNFQAALTDFGLSPDLNADPAGYPPNPIEYEEDCQELFGNDQLEYERCLCLHFPATAAEQSIDCPSYEPIYWYHPDYLGHTDFVTDRTGQPYQHFFYAPFGEALLSQHTGTGYYNTPYRFNAKELDSETGLIYYGARYYEPKESVWMSVDPLAHKYPGLSGYNFVANNPLIFIDPTGTTIEPAGEEEAKAYDAYRRIVFSDNKKYGHIQKELLRLESADEVFRIRMGENVSKVSKGGNLIYNKSSGEFDVNLGSDGDFNTIEKLAHELKHADQYINRKLGFDLGGNEDFAFPVAYDRFDELEAFARQGMFGKTLSPEQVHDRYSHLPFRNITIENIKYKNYTYDGIKSANKTFMARSGKPRVIYYNWLTDISE